jgi:hypothetical protein
MSHIYWNLKFRIPRIVLNMMDKNTCLCLIYISYKDFYLFVNNNITVNPF